MAKKKKHRKTRKQKLARGNQARLTVNNDIGIRKEDSSIVKKTHKVANGSLDNTASNEQTMDSLDYVKKDVKSSLVLAGFIVAAFGFIYFVLSSTSIGAQIYSAIKL